MLLLLLLYIRSKLRLFDTLKCEMGTYFGTKGVLFTGVAILC
jgi:hypothetical protein